MNKNDMKNTIIITAFGAFLFMASLISSAYAQEKIIGPLQMPEKIQISLIRQAEQSQGDFTIYLNTLTALSGCTKFGDLQYDLIFKEHFLDIRLLGYPVGNKSKSRAPHYGCAQNATTPSAMIPLDAVSLRANGTKKIRFDTGLGLEYYDVELSKHFIRLVKKETQTPQPRLSMVRIAGIIDPLHRWFYPENTVILSAPKAPKGQDIATQVNVLALQYGLTPLSAAIQNFSSPLSRPHHYYYIDKSGRYSAVPNTRLGAITVPLKSYGISGDIWENHQLEVYVRPPSMYE